MCDLHLIGLIGGMGSALDMMVQEGLGDQLLEGTFWSPQHPLDVVFLVVECTDQRAQDMQGGLEVIGRRKIGRKIRTKTTKKSPGAGWRHTLGE